MVCSRVDSIRRRRWARISIRLRINCCFLLPLYSLALNRKISWWLATLVLSRDIILLTSAAVILVVVGYRKFPPSIYGKITTAMQIALVFSVVLLGVVDWRWLQHARNILVDLVTLDLPCFQGFTTALRLRGS